MFGLVDYFNFITFTNRPGYGNTSGWGFGLPNRPVKTFTMTKEQIDFIRKNEMHVLLVIESNQHFQRSHDVAKHIIAIAETLDYDDHKAGDPVDYCSGCEKLAYQAVWQQYQLSQDGKKSKGN